MARIGLKKFRFGILTEETDGTATYGTMHTPGKAVSCSVSITNNNATLYADDALAESDKTFQSGTVSLTLDNDDLETLAILLGHTITNGNLVRNANDTAPYVGIARIITKMINGSYQYIVEFLNKVKFAEPNQEENTKGENVEFGTTQIEGTVATLANGNWSVAQAFTSLSAAEAYLESLFASSPSV